MAPLFAVLGSSLIQNGVEAIGELFQKGSTNAIKKATKIIKKKTGIDLTEIKTLEDLKPEQLQTLQKYDKKFALEELDKLLGDTKDARKADAQRQIHGTFLTRNTGSFLALFLFGFTFFLCYEVIDQLSGFFDDPEKITALAAVYSSVISLIIGTLLALCGQVATFYFGPGKQKADEDKVKLFQDNFKSFDIQDGVEQYNNLKPIIIQPQQDTNPIVTQPKVEPVQPSNDVNKVESQKTQEAELTEHQKRVNEILGNENEQL